MSGDGPVLVRMHAMDPILDVLWAPVQAGRPAELRRCDAADRGRGARGRWCCCAICTMKLKRWRMRCRRRRCANTGWARRSCPRLDLSDLILMTNSPQPKVVGLDAYGLSIVWHPQNLGSLADGWTHPLRIASAGASIKPVKLALVVSPYYKDIADQLVAGAKGRDRGCGRHP